MVNVLSIAFFLYGLGVCCAILYMRKKDYAISRTDILFAVLLAIVFAMLTLSMLAPSIAAQIGILT